MGIYGMGNDQCGAIEFVRGYQKRTEQELESFLAGELANLSVQRRLLYGDPSVSGGCGGTQGGRHTPAPLPAAPVQILKQCGRARSSGFEKASLAGERLPVVFNGVADVTGNRGCPQ